LDRYRNISPSLQLWIIHLRLYCFYKVCNLRARCDIINNSNMTSFFSFVTKRANYTSSISIWLSLARGRYGGGLKMYGSCCCSCIKIYLRDQYAKLYVLDTTLLYHIYHWLINVQWFSPATQISPSYKTVDHDIIKILLKSIYNLYIQS
jgi:hypothetical protein